MPCVYVFSEDVRLAAELVTTAVTVSDQVHVVCLGSEAAATLADAGAGTVISLTADEISLTADEPRPEAFAPSLARLVGEREGDLLLIGATVSGWEIAGRVAAILGCGLVSGATALRSLPDGQWQSERNMYAGGAVQTETWTGLAIVTIAPGQGLAFTSRIDAGAGIDAGSGIDAGNGIDAGSGIAEVMEVQVDSRVRVVSHTVRERESVDLALAARVVCVGMGVATADDLGLAQDLAHSLGGEIACTRPVAEDRRWLPAERYIGISGVSVQPDLYVGLGVSGQVQHTIGIRDAKVIVGINTNPDATLFGVCDYAVVGDLREIAPLLTAAITANSPIRSVARP
ncbi:MAG TPA: electron transfer flavoprotein subunit alpha/FixB family protein [Dermatophilaceae bacterium]